ncbi:hypothetical protein HPB52_024383 [Rhipicephalus sanguineus]|uniref:CCHC-type domain-containing protein n=1 Tax=Rhipicephalus sanguineus TaxID=34632 RepID=A0A9D4SLV3_RHISA|nr:hypothetical protein HPB52_024383 [Rhipicephalus sanguineus]
MEVVQVEGEEISPTEFGKEQGWCEIKRNTKKAAGDADSAKNQQATPASTEKAAFIQKATQYVRKITMTSRMPNLPTDYYKIIVRRRDGFNVSHYQKDRVHCCIRNAAGVGREVAEEDSVCLNERQNVIVVSTPSEDRARRYGGICKLRIGDREFEASAYRAAPENTSKGLIRGISLDEQPADVVRSLVNHRNPNVLHAKRMGNTTNVIILFDGYYVPRYVNYGGMVIRCTLYKKHIDMCYECGRLGHRADVCPNPNDKKCRGCGCGNPPDDHRCEPVCQLCGKGHLTGDRKCKAKYKIPYLVKRRQWERRMREEAEAAYSSSSTGRYPTKRRRISRTANHNTYMIEIQVDAGPHHRVHREGTKGKKHRLVDWDAFRKVRKEQNRGSAAIEDIDSWTATLKGDLETATREVPPEAELEVIDSKLLHMLEAKRSLQDRWKRQRHNRTLRRRIARPRPLARLSRDMEEHALQVCKTQWEEICNGMENQLGRAKTWHLLRHLLDPAETKTSQAHKINKLLHDYKGTSADFLDDVRSRYFQSRSPLAHSAYAWEDMAVDLCVAALDKDPTLPERSPSKCTT